MLYNMDELLRMKRKEKHMAPIDCSGVRNFVKKIQDTSQWVQKIQEFQFPTKIEV